MLAIRFNTYPQQRLKLEIKGQEEQNRKTHAEGTGSMQLLKNIKQVLVKKTANA